MRIPTHATWGVIALLTTASPALAQHPLKLADLEPGLRAVAEGTEIPLSHRPMPQRLSPGEAALDRAPAAPLEFARPREFSAIFQFDGPRAALEAAGIRVNSQVGNIFTANLRPEEVQNLTLVAGIRNAQLARYVQLHLDRSIADARGDLVHGAPSGSPPVYPGTTGKGMILGDVDTGIDVSLPDFKNPVTGLTRILYVWDQTVAGTPPAGFGYGTEWTAAQIDGASCTETDTNGHGTWVAGVLAGNGASAGCGVAAYRYVGMAPEANLIEVKCDLTDAHIIDGVNYVFQKAAALGKDAVVNLSLGSQFGPHDGSDTFGQAISALTGPGRIVVASSGNDEDTDSHGLLTTTTTTPNTDKFTITVPSYTKNSGTSNDYFLITGWYDPSVSLSLRMKGPVATDTLSVGFGSFGGHSTTGGYIYIADQNAGQGYGGTATKRQFEAEVYDAVAANAPRTGTWELDINTNSGSPTGKRVDIWIYACQLGSLGALATVATGLNLSYMVGTPGDADSVLCVGAHTTKAQWYSCSQAGYCHYTLNPTLNDIAEFSNIGPRVDGVLKPELTAPGFGVASTRSTSSAPLGTCGDDSDGVHEVVAGTSFAAPHVAAAVALFQQHRKLAPPSLVKASFERHARTDGFTGAVPNNTWGWGKLDVWAAIDHTPPTVHVTSPVGGEHWVGGSTHNITWTAVDSIEVDSVKLEYSVDNGLNWNPITSGLPNSGTYTWTVPVYFQGQLRVRTSAWDECLNVGSAVSDSAAHIVAVGDRPGAVFALDRGRPNPSPGLVSIHFSLPHTGPGELAVFDLAGRRVATLAKGQLQAGPHEVTWNGAGAASGVYFYRLSAAGQVAVRRLVLVH
ncbi:MAG TPA: S8 family serine peptidase [Candidatus Saccharimonadales bacterium]|nr:S8 family serine peptidase [Candidatus Saccharimonadales bacterium]